MPILFLLLRLYLMSPAEANAWVAGEDMRLRVFLDRTALREAKGRRVSVHERDAHHSPSVWRAARRVGYIHPHICPGHDDPEGWSTRGVHGQMPGFNWRFLPWWLQCAPPDVFDVPVVSAYVAARKRAHLCEKRGACTHRELSRWWADGSPEEKSE